MDSDDSLQLFSHYAFKSHQLSDDYLDLSKALVETTGRLPLALQVIGSSLYSKSKPVWEDMLKKLQKVPNDDIMERLRISFDGLDQEEKEMFLDIACFFIGMYKNIVCYIWEGCGFNPLVGLDSLYEKSMITISERDVLGMHDLLRDLGRIIVYQENAKKPWKRTRIWSEKDVLDVLHTKAGTRSVRGLSVQFIEENEGLTSDGFVGMTRLELLQMDFVNFSWNFTNSFSELRWLSWKGCSNQFTQTNFCPRKLVVLDLSESYITADWKGWSYLKAATNLKVLDLSDCRQLSKTPDLSANQFLEVLHLKDCENLVEIDASICCLTKLVILDFRGCYKLKDAPSQINKLTNLQELKLTGTTTTKFAENLDCMTSLVDLEIKDWDEQSTLDLSVKISQLTAMETLFLDACDSLTSISLLPPSLTHLDIYYCHAIQSISGLPSSLTSLLLDCCSSVVSVSSTSRGLRNLKTLYIFDFEKLEEIEGFDDKLDSLEKFIIKYCHSLQKLPKLRGSKYLRTLLLSYNDSISDLEGEGLDSLEVLKIEDCKSLRRIPSLQDSKRLRELTITECPQVLKIECLGDCESLQELKISHCRRWMVGLLDLSNLHKLRNLDIVHLNNLTKISGLDRLGSLQRLRIEECENLSEINGINGLENLEELNIRCCTALKNLPDLSNAKKSKHLTIEGLENLDEIEELNISRCEFLKKLKISRVSHLKRLPDLSLLKNLGILHMEGCNDLIEILCVGELKSLFHLHVSGCESLESLPDLSNLKSLRELCLSGCESLQSLLDLSNLKRLEKLHIEGCKILSEIHGIDGLRLLNDLEIVECESLTRLPDLSSLERLQCINIKDCRNLTEIQGVDTLESLIYLSITGCESLEISPDLSKLKYLKTLIAKDCRKLTAIQAGNNPLGSLRKLDVRGCISLEELPNCVKSNKLEELNGVPCTDLTDIDRIKLLIDGGCSKFQLALS